MAWQTITTDDVLTQITDLERDLYNDLLTADGQDDPLPEIIAGVVQEVRNGIAQNQRNTLGTGATIPTGALHHALAMVRYRFITRVPGVDIDDTRKEAYRDALTWLRSAPLVEKPDDAAETQLGGSRPTYSPRCRRFTRENMNGI